MYSEFGFYVCINGKYDENTYDTGLKDDTDLIKKKLKNTDTDSMNQMISDLRTDSSTV